MKFLDLNLAKEAPGEIISSLHGYKAFLPKSLPPKIDFNEFALELSQAQQNLSQLAGLVGQLKNPYLLSRPFIRREAQSSSAIEGTYTTISDLLTMDAMADQASSEISDDTIEAHNYIEALFFLFDEIDKIPLGRRTICQAHKIMLTNIKNTKRGANKRPGAFRVSEPAWTGSLNIKEAEFVFAPSDHLDNLFSDFEKYIQNVGGSSPFPVLVDIALIHYQFETIHPFHDGNGRIGRLLIPSLLKASTQLTEPLLYISPFFQEHKKEYIDRLNSVRIDGDWNGWIKFFLKGVSTQSFDAFKRAQKLLKFNEQLRKKYLDESSSTILLSLIDLIFESPIISIPFARKKTGQCSYSGMKKNVSRLVKDGLLVEIPNTRPRRFMAFEIYDIIYDSLD